MEIGMEKNLQILKMLAVEALGIREPLCELMKGDGSARRIFKIISSEHQKVYAGVIHSNLKENSDFIRITEEMRKQGIPAPEVLGVADNGVCYVLDYLGEFNLAEQIDFWGDQADDLIVSAYKKVIDWMPDIQFKLIGRLDNFFENRQMGIDTYREDLEYWKKNFLEKFAFAEQYNNLVKEELEIELLRPLSEIPSDSFVYRDFQSRNFMWVDHKPVFIDYQTAYQGPLYYDLASMLYASRSGLNEAQRSELVQYYFEKVKPVSDFNAFKRNLYRFVLLRRLRSLGSYGYLGCDQHKTHFLKSVQPTLSELLMLFDTQHALKPFRHLKSMIQNVLIIWKETQFKGQAV